MPDADLSSSEVASRGVPVTLKPSKGRQGSLVRRLPLLPLLLFGLLSGCCAVVAKYRKPTNGPAAHWRAYGMSPTSGGIDGAVRPESVKRDPA